MVEYKWLVSLTCRPLFTLVKLKWLKFAREWIEWNVNLNLRPGGTTRRNGCIIEWEGRGVVCGYSRLQGGSPCLCRLRTVHSGPLNEYLIMY
jgi:hypothetical protein